MNYNLRYPSSQKSKYTSSDLVDFVMSFPGKAFVGNSIRISGVLNVYSTGTTRIVSTDRIYYDGMVGIHSFMDNISVSTQTRGVIEGISQYPRLIKMQNSASKTANQVVTDSKSFCQLLCQDSLLTNTMMTYALPFSCDLAMCLNNVIGADIIAYSKTGDITISFRFVQPADALFGADMTPNVNFTVENLACEYIAMDEPKVLPPVQMTLTYPVKQTINSSTANISIKLPAVVNTVYASFMLQSQESQLTFNNLDLQQPTGINKLNYLFNDTTNALVSYPIETIEDILEHYLLAFYENGKGGKNNATLVNINDNKFFGIGLYYENQMNMLTSSFGLNIQSAISNIAPFSMFAFFRGIIAM